LLFARHRPLIVLVIVASEVEHSMQHKNLDLLRWRMAQPPGVLRGDIGCDRYVASKSI
jgi:hypothetical protein